MPRYFYQGTKPIQNFEVYHGWDQDVEKWFIEVEICCLGKGSIVQWYNNEKEYLLCLRNYTH
tara:strand:- start:269 stop:454 length:186 start_codon:yes stop_codon:yes gene_type:complete